MDHLMTDEQLEWYKDDIPTIPWIGGDHDISTQYPVVPLLEYLSLRGWTDEELEDPRLKLAAEPEKALSQLQACLLFGVLEAATGHRFQSGIRQGDGSQGSGVDRLVIASATGHVVTFKPLRHLSPWWTQMLEACEPDLDERRNELYATTGQACAVVTNLVIIVQGMRSRDYTPGQKNLFEALESIIRCTLLLVEMVINSAPVALLLGESRPRMSTVQVTDAMAASLFDRFTTNGWCSSVPPLLLRNGYSMLEYTSFLKADDLPASKHDACSKTACIAHNITDRKPLHVEDGCDCPMMKPKFADVSDIIGSGGIPVLQYQVQMTRSKLECGTNRYLVGSTPELIVRRYEPEMDFLAISHVWSDGLRGTTETGLPRCQVERMSSQASRMGLQSFWLDALAIPEDRSLRKRAIKSMADIYRSASRTVILDGRLQRLQVTKSMGLEIFLRAYTSTWFRRLWTLQEVVLSKDPIILFGNAWMRLAHFEETAAELMATWRNPVVVAIVQENLQISGQKAQDWSLAHVARLLGPRSSTHEDDQTIAIAGLLDLDVAALLEVAGEERMKIFWLQLGVVPSDIILTDYARMTVDGFGALPRSLIGSNSTTVMATAEEADFHVTSSGVRGTCWIYESDAAIECSLRQQWATHDRTTNQGFVLELKRHDIEHSVVFDAVLLLQPLASNDHILSGAAACKTGESVEGLPIYKWVERVQLLKGTFKTTEIHYKMVSHESEILIA